MNSKTENEYTAEVCRGEDSPRSTSMYFKEIAGFLTDEFHDELALAFFRIITRHKLDKCISWTEATSDYLEEISKTIAEELLKIVDMEK